MQAIQIEGKPLLEAEVSLVPSVLLEDLSLSSLKHFSLTFNQEKLFDNISELLSRAPNLESLYLVGAGEEKKVELIVSH